MAQNPTDRIITPLPGPGGLVLLWIAPTGKLKMNRHVETCKNQSANESRDRWRILEKSRAYSTKMVLPNHVSP